MPSDGNSRTERALLRIADALEVLADAQKEKDRLRDHIRKAPLPRSPF